MSDEDKPTEPEPIALGAVRMGCPWCAAVSPRQTNLGVWACAACGARFAVASYYQRVAGPAPEPAP